jgi:hypothetical protein
MVSFTPREREPGTHWIGGWVGPRAGLDAVVKRKIPSPCRDSNPPIIQPVAKRYTTKINWTLETILRPVQVLSPLMSLEKKICLIRYYIMLIYNIFHLHSILLSLAVVLKRLMETKGPRIPS